jgi:Ca2+-binding EF-hand superfamily protein/thiol-disulfide isomerase/thioredoxin
MIMKDDGLIYAFHLQQHRKEFTTLRSSPADVDHQDANAAWRFASLHGSSIGANIEAKHPLSVQQYYPSHQEIVTAVQQEYSKQQQQKQQPLRPMPKLQQGVYQLTTEAEYTTLIQSHPDNLVIVKFYAAYCKACRALAPKFLEVKDDPQLANLPVVWAEFQTKRHTKELFQRLGVLTLPTIHFYDGGMLHLNDSSGGSSEELTSNLIENFPCPPAKINLLKKKIARFMNSRVDPETRQLKPIVVVETEDASDFSLPSHMDHIDTHAKLLDSEQLQHPMVPDLLKVVDQPKAKRRIVIDNELIRDEHLTYLRSGMPFFRDLTDQEFDSMISQARLLTFNIGDVICKQGMPGDTFYVLKRGVVEMSVKSRFEDPIRTPPNYLGAVVGELRKFDYFGERALSTGQPLAASFRVVEKVRCFAFPVDIIPESSILSKNRRASQELIEQLDKRYTLPDDYVPPSYGGYPNEADDRILDLLVRFKQIRQAARCFSYIMQTEPRWNDPGEIARRATLVRKLSDAQRKEFEDVFEMVDVKKSGMVSLLEMRKFMNTAREKKTDAELMQMIHRANPSYAQAAPSYAQTATITRNEFLGVMAEAEFYNLFTATFQELDQDDTGYVRAGDLAEVLGGVQELIADEKKINLIDGDDVDMLIDYEQFSKMLLGAAF